MPKEIESEWLDARPRIVVSRCLGFDACRWNGEMIWTGCTNAMMPRSHAGKTKAGN